MSESTNKEQASNFFNKSELERYTVLKALVNLSKMLAVSEDENNVLMGTHLLGMADNLMKTLPNINGGVRLDADLTNVSVKDEDLDSIIDQFFN